LLAISLFPTLNSKNWSAVHNESYGQHFYKTHLHFVKNVRQIGEKHENGAVFYPVTVKIRQERMGRFDK
jgi:hypothetical protein